MIFFFKYDITQKINNRIRPTMSYHYQVLDGNWIMHFQYNQQYNNTLEHD